jgi:hypothetical protein
MTLQAQTAREAFTSMPESMLPDLSLYSRMDLVDLYTAGQPAVVVNSFNDTITLENLTQDYLLLKTGDKNTLQIITLPMINESKLYALIHTVCAPVCDSRMEFYSVSWNPLNASAFIQPAKPVEFMEENRNLPALDISLMQLDYDSQTLTLTQTFNTPQYISMEDENRIRPFIKAKTKACQWNGIRFEWIE